MAVSKGAVKKHHQYAKKKHWMVLHPVLTCRASVQILFAGNRQRARNRL